MPIVNHTYIRQPNYFYCGPTATAIALNAQGQIYSLDQVAAELHTTTDGTNSVDDVSRVLNGHGLAYSSVFIGGNAASAAEVDALWKAIQRSVTNGFAVVANVVGSVVSSDGVPYSYPQGHYVTIVGFDKASRGVNVADVNTREYWITVEQMADWIAQRGYSYYSGPVAPVGAASVSEPSPAQVTLYDDSKKPIFGVDLSDFDSDRGNSPEIVARYRSEGISFVTHKSVEVTNSTVYRHTRLGVMLTAVKDSGMPFVGSYVVPRTGPSPERIADEHVAFLDSQIPWWRTFDGFFHQVDLEAWEYDNVSAEIGNAVFERLLLTGKPVIKYASKGQYGDSALSVPRWNANYPTRTSLPYRELYDLHGGNDGPGWASYGTPNRVPEIWQYGDSGVVAGQGSTDVNAFRGSELDFAKMLGIPTTTTDEEEEMAKPIFQKVLQSTDDVQNSICVVTLREDGKFVKSNVVNIDGVLAEVLKALGQSEVQLVKHLDGYPDA